MEKSPLIRAHAHVSKAQKILSLHNPPTPDEIKSASREHARAAELFKEASRLVKDEEAIRTSLLLATQQQHKADALASFAQQATTIKTSAPSGDGTKDVKEAVAAVTSQVSAPSLPAAPTPSVPRSTRTPHLATTLASARGIPANPPSRSNSSGSSEEHFLSNINGFMGMLRTPLAMPLGFAGLPLGGNSNSNAEAKPNYAKLMPKNHPMPPTASQSRGIAESFYVVQPTGGTVPYADMLRRGTESPGAGGKPVSLQNSMVLQSADEQAGLEAENARLKEMLAKTLREEEEWKKRASNAEKDAQRLRERWDKLKDNARERKSKQGKAPLESVKE